MSGFQRWCESSSGKPWKILRTTITGTLINQSCSVIFQCCDIFYLWLLHKTPHSKISAATRTVNQGSPHPTSMFCGKFFDIYITLTLQFTNSIIHYEPWRLALVRHPARDECLRIDLFAKLKGLNNGVFLLHAVWYQNAKIQFITQARVYCT